MQVVNKQNEVAWGGAITNAAKGYLNSRCLACKSHPLFAIS